MVKLVYWCCINIEILSYLLMQGMEEINIEQLTISYVPQPDFYSCGEACLAMIANLSIEEAQDAMNHKNGGGSSALYQAFRKYKIDYISWRSIAPNESLPLYCMLLVKFPTYTHSVVYYDGVYYDPEFGVLHSYTPNGEITHYLIILDEKVYNNRNLEINIPEDFKEAFALDPDSFNRFNQLSNCKKLKLIYGISHYKSKEVRSNNITKQLSLLKQNG